MASGRFRRWPLRRTRGRMLRWRLWPLGVARWVLAEKGETLGGGSPPNGGRPGNCCCAERSNARRFGRSVTAGVLGRQSRNCAAPSIECSQQSTKGSSVSRGWRPPKPSGLDAVRAAPGPRGELRIPRGQDPNRHRHLADPTAAIYLAVASAGSVEISGRLPLVVGRPIR